MKKNIISKIENTSGFNVLIALCMLYMSTMLLNAILTNRYIGTDSFFLLGGVFVSPFLFILDDIIAEIYGYKIVAAQTIFALSCQLAIMAPYPASFKEAHAYSFILGPALLRIDISGFIAYISANLVNSYIITRWKVLLKGKHFWLRSLGSSTLAEALYSLIAVLMIEINSLPMKNLIKIILIIYLVKALTSILFAFPAQILVSFIKGYIGIDVYDLPKKFTPITSLKKENIVDS
jgi:uncharacterized PurR-regulated membrane protein YhhQ (DUF165 family)